MTISSAELSAVTGGKKETKNAKVKNTAGLEDLFTEEENKKFEKEEKLKKLKAATEQEYIDPAMPGTYWNKKKYNRV